MNYKDYTIKIEQDDMAESPREWDRLGSMICFHKRYNLGDKHTLHDHDFDDWNSVAQWFKDNGYAIVIPLYLYDHSGLTISTTPFSCSWDSGQIGYIAVTREDVLKEFGGKYLTSKKAEKAYKALQAEVETYDQFLRGDVWGFIVTNPDGEEVHSCWGFYGQESCEAEAKDIVDCIIDREEKNCGIQMEMAI